MNKEWKPYPGMQTKFLQSTAFETLAGGSRGPGKTDVGVINGAKPKYLNSPRVRGLVIRKNADDLADWLDRARYYYARYGGVVTGKPGVVTFPSGYKIKTGHLKDENAYTKYQGQEYQWILIEELTQIAREIDYLKLIASCRSSIPGIDPRVYATTNPGGVGHCVPYGDVLTPEGWKKISNIKVGDLVLTDIGGKSAFAPVSQIVEENYEGELLVSSNWSARFIATPHHKLPIITETKNKKSRTFHEPKLREIKNFKQITRLPKIGKWEGKQIEVFILENKESRKPKLTQPMQIKGDDYCELMGWFLSEGSVVERDKAFSISQMKKENRKIIEDLLIRCGFSYKKSAVSFIIHSVSWYEYLKQFGKCRDKYVPLVIKNSTPEQLTIFLEAAIRGDGHKNHYYTTSKQLADDICEIGLKLQKRIYLSSRNRPNREGLSYDISFKPNKIGWIEFGKISPIDYKGKVYCLGIEKYHTFYLRQNGTIFLSGNSWVKKRFIDPAPPNTKFIGSDTGRARIFLPGTVDDNPALMDNDPSYVKMLDGLKDTDVELWKAWRLGDWDTFAGQFFREFRRDLHVVRPFMPRSDIKRVGGMDWGRTDPFCFLAAIAYTVKYNGIDRTNPQDTTEKDYTFTRVIIFQEAYGTDKLPREWAERINLICPINTLEWIQSDNQIFNKSDTDHSTSIAQQFYDYDSRFYGKLRPASKERVTGWESVRQWLSIAPDGSPYCLIAENCQNLIRTLPELVHDDVNVEDIDESGEDHSADSLRYLLKAIRWIDARTGPIKAKELLQSDKKYIKIDKPLLLDAWNK